MTCLIIEDQPPAQRILKKYIADIGTLELKGTFTDAIQAMNFLRSQPIDLLFLDIHLPKMSGIDFLKTIAQPPHVILTTAFPDYALESYEFNVVDYLLKPFSFQRFVKAIQKIPIKNELPPSSSHALPSPDIIFVKSGYELIKVDLRDIIFIQSSADYTEIVFSEKKILSSETLRYWEDLLHNKHFIRVHKSYLANMIKIKKISATRLYLEGSIDIPVGRTYKEGLVGRFNAIK